jgi:hypothetical protein
MIRKRISQTIKKSATSNLKFITVLNVSIEYFKGSSMVKRFSWSIINEFKCIFKVTGFSNHEICTFWEKPFINPFVCSLCLVVQKTQRGCLRSRKALIGYSLSIDKPTDNESNETILPYRFKR